MNTPRQELETRVKLVVLMGYVPGRTPAGPYVRPCPDPRHGDFQTNFPLVWTKESGLPPRDIAAQMIELIEWQDICETPEIAGPGFINFRLKPDWLAAQVKARLGDARLGMPLVEKPETVVIDYSGPNIAKEMHVGHLRSTVLGDALARLFVFLGHRVIADNHIGDWGTGFGMILFGYKREGDPEKLKHDPFGHLEEIYRRVQAEAKTDEKVNEAARRELVKLQQGDPENLALWTQFRDTSLAALEVIYQRLGVQFDHTLGESFYNDMLAPVVEEFLKRELARESEGAVAIFSDGTLPPKEDPFLVSDKGEFRENPLLIRKSDGGYNYATTDLATIRYRHDHFHADRVLYVVDGRQQMHFRQLFEAARRWDYGGMKFEHVWFGTILGPDKKPFKSREGENVKFRALLDEAEERAAKVILDRARERAAKNVAERRPELGEHERTALARVVGLGALKYADLAQNRNLDYVFNWEKLLAFDGNTAPYLQNAYVRIRAIFRKSGLAEAPAAEVVLNDPAERALARKLLDFADSLFLAAEECRPHYLCLYLFELATIFHKFYEACPVLTAGPPVRDSRLVLCEMTARTLRQGLELLGIATVEQM